MGKFDNKKIKKRNKGTLVVLVLALIAIVLVIFVALMVLPLMMDNGSADEGKVTVPTVQAQQPEESTDPNTPTDTEEPLHTEDPTYSTNPADSEEPVHTEDPTYSNEVVESMGTEPAVETEESDPAAETETNETQPKETEAKETEPKETVDKENEGTKIQEVVSFPLVLADGKLGIENAFQFDGLNPDCENQEGYNIAAITVKNLSDEYLAKADISITTDGGITLQYVILDLPSGKSTVAFATDNATTNADTQYGDVVCDVVFDPDASMNEEKISVSVDGIQIVLENNTGEQIDEVVVYCRSTMGDQYFGGITYTYTVNNLPANGTAEVMAVDCILGLAEVVRVVINES